MSTNSQRAAWAAECLGHFQGASCVDTRTDAVTDLIVNIGHFCVAHNLPFLHLVARGVGHWHLELTDPDSIDVLPRITINIHESN